MPRLQKRKLPQDSSLAAKKTKISKVDHSKARKVNGKTPTVNDNNVIKKTVTRSGRKSSQKVIVNYNEESEADDLSSDSDFSPDPVWKADKTKNKTIQSETSTDTENENEELTFSRPSKSKSRQRAQSKSAGVLSLKRADTRNWDKLSESSDSSDNDKAKSPNKDVKKVVNSVSHVTNSVFHDQPKSVELKTDVETLSESDEFQMDTLEAPTSQVVQPKIISDVKKENDQTVMQKHNNNRRSSRSKKVESKVTPLASSSAPPKVKSPQKSKMSLKAKAESSDESDWEEVVESNDISLYNPEIPQEGIDIMLALPKELQNKKSKYKKSNAELFQDYCCVILRRIIKENHFRLHKTHLLCLIAQSFHVIKVSSSVIVKALLLSIVPPEIQTISAKNIKLENIREIIAWFHDEFIVSSSDDVGKLENLFPFVFSLREGPPRLLVYLFAALMWHLGIECRIVFAYHPVPIKNFKFVENPFRLDNFDMARSASASSRYLVAFKCKKKTDPKPKQINKLKSDNVGEGLLEKKVTRKRNRQKSTKALESDDEGPEKKGNSRAKNNSSVRKSSRKKLVTKHAGNSGSEFEGSNSDFEEEEEFYSKPVKTKKVPKKAETSKAVAKYGPIDEWLEIYLKKEKKYVCVDCINNLVDEEDRMEENCSSTISYVLAFTKDRKLKDVTERYASGWLNTTPKLRLDWHCGPEWWEETLKPYYMKGNKVTEENKQLQKKAMNLPLPKSISEYKHHKLYALARHLLKFEAIYPPDAPPLGFIRGEPIYARECVRTLYSRDHWVQQARTVKIGESPYKIVKARPGFKKRENDENRMLELFGHWQTEVYDPPPVVDGKIPRNAYGNVELFKPEMLPKGARYLTGMSGLSRVARKLNIDCAQAMVGWDFRKGRNVPMLDGWIVCEEHVEILQAAWDEEQVHIRKREEEKRDKRIYGNWRKLIKGLLIKKKIELKYGTGKESE